MNLLDSSGWLEYFADGKNAEFFAPVAQDTEHLIVPVICLYEVFKVILRERNQADALQAIAVMQEAEVVDINEEIALSASQISHQKKLPMADSIIYSISEKNKATLWTQDSDFKDLPNVKFFQNKF